MKTENVLRVIVSSPSDVKVERDSMDDIIKKLNEGYSDIYNVQFKLCRWEYDAYPGIHSDGPQGIIDTILDIEECDILIGMFWNRFGTPTKGELSGTAYEIKKAIQCWEKKKKPQIMIYFKNWDKNNWKQDQISELLEEQLNIHKFRNNLPQEVLTWEYNDHKEFKDIVCKHLSGYLKKNFRPQNTNLTTQTYLQVYCKVIQPEFETINVFTKSESMGHINYGFIPMNLKEVGKGKNAPPINIEDLFFQEGAPMRYIIRGFPGGGKTTLLRYLGFKFSRLCLENKLTMIPVFFRLRYFQSSKMPLEKYIQQEVDAKCSDASMADALIDNKCCLEKQTILLLDGLDEIEESETNDKIAEILDEFARNHPRCNIVITSRPIALDFDDYPRYTALDLQPLTTEMIDEYVSKWFCNDNVRIEQLKGIFQGKQRILSLATNPFLLSMICYTCEQDENMHLLECRSTLYGACTKNLLERSYEKGWAKKRNVDYKIMLGILKDVSLRFFLWQEAEFSIDHVNIMGKNILEEPEGMNTELYLDRLQRETGLVQHSKEGFVFVHRSLWEYFTAMALVDKKPEFAIRQAANPDWEEVIRLYAGLLKNEEDIKELFKGLWTINRPLALRITTELQVSARVLIEPYINKKDGKLDRLILIDSLEQSLPLIDEKQRSSLVLETLNILLIECSEKDCEVIYHAQQLLEKMNHSPLQDGGFIFNLFTLNESLHRQEEFLNDPSNLFEWIKVDGGEFIMGDNTGSEREKPEHAKNTKGFLCAKHPVTIRMMSKFPFGEKFEKNYGGENNPAVMMTWFEAYYFALWIGARLPTETEWEYAARGGGFAGNVHTKYFFGDDISELSNHAWYGDSSRDYAHAVDELNPRTNKENCNQLGLANILGNVWEWCSDWNSNNYNEESGSDEDERPNIDNQRILRGGSWYRDAQAQRCACRLSFLPDFRYNCVGVRCVKDIE